MFFNNFNYLKTIFAWIAYAINWLQNLFVTPGKQYNEVYLWSAAGFHDVSHLFNMHTLHVKNTSINHVGTFQIRYSIDSVNYRQIIEDTEAHDLHKVVAVNITKREDFAVTLLSAFNGDNNVTPFLMEFAGPSLDFAHGTLRLKYLKSHGIDTLQIMDSAINEIKFTDADDIIQLTLGKKND